MGPPCDSAAGGLTAGGADKLKEEPEAEKKVGGDLYE